MTGPALPPRREGSHHDTVSMHCHDSDATGAYREAHARLLNINGWHLLNQAVRTEFQLCDADGSPVDRLPRVGDCIRIDLPGPGSPSGGGYDWVAITEMDEVDGEFPYASITVAPCPAPGTDEEAVAHFFAAGATNTFVVRRVGNCVQAEVHGRNEKPNNTDPALLDRIRNEAVALAGKVGLSNIQWIDWARGVVSVVEADPDR
ncbi:hypothetical protein GGR26_002133 [Lewinella marina]|uniref:Uncharacterized protein n=1 Tax=Neolewinella marina TaxID=438751 RepID=A0A2G0CGX3_9BACT|nr:hypothetical protein [Neolewinella marina]NJB86365.1 hypothetical protein [Neolewinella marina]PHK99167.1 hypothetical protein CGL56_06830 [Neolewinella marina]